ncbi:hypothetical protein ACFRQM_09460 [Streptomyces sp. NPDC056831]|uniref:hypothetical protein n=1 Tax=Streptomyces sp. NPDC056831 TaxID=3345954 RepID=UPI0036A69F2D
MSAKGATMTTTNTPDHEQQPRIPGVRYRPVVRYRLETTAINGLPETREVPYTVMEPEPPRDWDALIIRGVTGVAIGVTALAVVSTATSIGGLLHKTVPAPIAYGVAVIFSATWLACQALEYVERLEPTRARNAQLAGWAALLISMSAVVMFGVDKNEPVAGAAGAAVDLMAKGLWTLVLGHYAVPLSEGVAHWLRRRREKITAAAAVAGQVRRLDQHEAYLTAVYGPTAATAQAVTTMVEAPALQGGPAMSGQAPLVSGQTVSAPAPAPAPAVPVSAPAPAAPPVSPAAASQEPAVPAPASVAAPVVPAAAVPQPVPPVASAPAVPAPVVPAPAVPVVPAAAVPAPVPPVVPALTEQPALHAVGELTKTGTIRAALVENSAITDDALIAWVTEVHGKDPKNSVSVPRLRRRIESKAKKKAS